MRNTKEVAIIKHRTGKLSEMPHELNQSEIGLAYDENRLFIGNSKNTALSQRDEFPYQNLEIATEGSDFMEMIKYHYTNNIDVVDGESECTYYQEKLPILMEGTSAPSVSSQFSFTISNGSSVSETIIIPANSSLDSIISLINAQTETTHVIATKYQGKTTLALIGFGAEITISAVSGDIAQLGLSTYSSSEVLLPYRKLNKKLDDILSIKDFAYKVTIDEEDSYVNIDGNGSDDVSEGIFNALSSVFGKNSDAQFKRGLYFPAGTYYVNSLNKSLPLMNGSYIYGEGIDRTIIKGGSTYTYPLFATYDTQFKYADSHTENVSNITIKDLTIDCSNTSASYMMYFKNVEEVIFENVKFIGGNVANGIKFFGTSNNVRFNNCHFSGFSTSTVEIANGSEISFNGCRFINYNKALTIVGNYCQVVNCYFTSNVSGAQAINGSGGSYNSLVNNVIGYSRNHLQGWNDNINLVTDDSHVILIKDSGSTAYEDRIEDIDNAVPNVAYVNKVAGGGTSTTDNGFGIRKELTYSNISSSEIEIYEFPTTSNKEVKLVDMRINMVQPFLKLYSNLANAANYINGNLYYIGDIIKQTVSGITSYGVVIANHTAITSLTESSNVVRVYSGLTDIKYIDIIARNGNTEYSLTKSLVGVNNTEELSIDVQAIDTYDYTYSTFQTGVAQNGLVMYQDKLYNVQMTADEATVDNLHNTSYAKQIPLNGNNYCYTFDKRIFRLGSSTTHDYTDIINSSKIDFSGYKLIMKFYDANGNVLSLSDTKNLNPSGLFVINLNYAKPAKSTTHRNYILTDGYEYTNANDMVTLTSYIGSDTAVVVPTIMQE